MNKRILIPLLFLLILPPFAMLVVGYQFQGQVVEQVPFAIADHDNSSLSRSLVKNMENSDTFQIVFFSETDQEIEAGLKSGKVAAAMIIPEHFEQELTAGRTPKLLMIYDNVQLSAAGTIKGKISEILGTLRAGSLGASMQGALHLSGEQTAALMRPLVLETRQINPGKTTPISSMHGSMLSMIQVAVFILALEITRKKDMYQPYLAISNAICCGFLGSLVAVVVTVIQVKLFHFPFAGSQAAAYLIAFLYLTAIASMGIFLRLFLKEKEGAVEKIGMLMMMMILSGYSYPLIAMPKIIQTIAPFIPFTHYGIPLRDIMFMGYGLPEVLSDIHWIVGFMLLLWVGIALVNMVPKIKSFSLKKKNEKEGQYAETLVK